MYVTICIECRCSNAMEVENQQQTLPKPGAPIKVAALVCIACKDISRKESVDYTSKYEDVITPGDIMTMQEWGYIVKFTQAYKRPVDLIKFGDYVRVFKDHREFMYKQDVVASVPITTCKAHRFDYHNR